MRVRQSVKVVNAKLERHNDAGIIETIDEAAGTVTVKFDTPDPDGELVEFKTGDLELLRNQG